MASDRVLGSAVTVSLYLQGGGLVTVAEVDSFKATRKSSQKQFQPLGQIGQRTQDIYEGYTLDFSGAVIDPSYEDVLSQLDAQALSGGADLRFLVTETTLYYDGSSLTWSYPDTVLFGFDKDASAANAEIKWTFKGEARTRVAG